MAVRVCLFLVFAALLAGSLCAPTFGQILEVPTKKEQAKFVRVTIAGKITQVKKYSFIVSGKQGQHEVTLAKGTRMVQRLNAPYFDFKANKVSTLRWDAKQDSEKTRDFYDIPKDLFVTMRFNQEKQLARLMSQPKLRLNNYLLTRTDPGKQIPTPENLILKGKIVVDGQQVWVDMGKKRIPAILGMHGAKMDGFSILDLGKDDTRVFVTGLESKASKVVTPTSVEFQRHSRSLGAYTQKK